MSKKIRTGVCLFLTLISVIAATFFITRYYYQEDHDHQNISNQHITVSVSPGISSAPVINEPPIFIDTVSNIPALDVSVSASPSLSENYFNDHINSLPRCIIPHNNRVLIVYDSNPNDEYNYLAELYAVVTNNLISHFRESDVIHLNNYENICGYERVVYLGYNYEINHNLERFIVDVFTNMERTPVMWMGTNIWKMVNSTTNSMFGFRYVQQRSHFHQIFYKGEWIDRNIRNDDISEVEVFNNHKTEILSYSYMDNKQIPWAIYSNRNFMYISEIPFSFIDHDDRYIVFGDLLFEFFNVNIHRNRAMVRLEDIGPQYNLEKFQASVNYLISQNVPFSFGVFPMYVSKTRTMRLRESPQMVEVIKHAMNNGGTLVYHGFTHQYKKLDNPYNGESGLDFEFYLTHVDQKTQSVVFDGPVPTDSKDWMNDRIQQGLDEFAFVGIDLPNIFEFPHYAGSDLDYRIISKRFDYRYDRGQYFIGTLNNSTIDYSKRIGHFNPFVIRDVYGSVVIPENLGNFIQTAINNNNNRFSVDIVNSARLNKNVLRDSVASFFFHPYLGSEHLEEIVSGIKELGYTFVSPNEIVNDFDL